MSKNKKIGLVTPMRDEIDNLPQLVKSIERLINPIFLWIIVDNESNDGSYEYIAENKNKIKNVGHLLLIQKKDEIDHYELGSKYARIVNYGFKEILKYERNNDITLDFVGILDSDCFPEKDYYYYLLKTFKLIPKLGIASGVIYFQNSNGKWVEEKKPVRWARGGIRVIRRECFEDTGYLVGMSADALMSAIAWQKGWVTQSFKNCKVYSREVGSRIDMSYIGKTSFYRGVPYYLVLIKYLILIIKLDYKKANNLLKGYKYARNNKINKDVPSLIIDYNKYLPLRIFVENIIVLKNKVMMFLKSLKN